MTSYNTFSKIAIAVSLLAGLSSCMNRDQHVTENGATFYVDSITPTFAPNKVNASGDVNQKFINMKACLKDNAQKSIIMNVPFAIRADAVEVKRVTDRDGCMTWQEMFEFNPKTAERQISMARNFVALSGHYGTVKTDLAYNPWKNDLQFLKLGLKAQSAEKAKIIYSAGQTISRVDNFTGESSSTQVDLQAKLQSTQLVPLDIANMRMDFLKRDFDQYEISPTLNLTIAHQYRLNFVVNAVKQTLDHGPTLDPVNQGKFRFYFLLLSEGYDPKKKGFDDPLKFVIGSTQFDTEGVVGRFRRDITLKFDKISALASRMTGILTVESIDQPDTFQVTTFEGMVTPVAGAGTQTLDLIPSNIDGKQLYSGYDALRKSNFELKGFDVFSKYSGFTILNTPSAGSFTRDPVTTFSFEEIFKTKKLPDTSDKTYAQALCFNYFIGTGSAEAAAYNACMNDAKSNSSPKMLTAALRDFVINVNDPMPTQTGIPQVETITISSGLDFTDKSNNEEGATYKKDKNHFGSLGASLGLGNTVGALTDTLKKIPLVGTALRIISFFGLSADVGVKMSWNKDWYYSSGLVQNQTKSSEIATSHSQVVTSESFTFNLKVSTKTCLLLTPGPELAKMLEGSKVPLGQFVCGKDVATGTRQETYYFINQSDGSASSPMSDNMSAADNPLRMFVRGPKTFELFAQLLTQDNTDLKLQKVSVEDRTDDLKKQLDQLDLYLTQEFPGMLMSDSSPINLPSAAAPPSSSPTGPAQTSILECPLNRFGFRPKTCAKK